MTCNWIRSLLDNQSDCTKFHGEFYFLFLRILASVIQGSVIGPASMSCTPEICNQSPTAMIWWSTQMTPILSSLKWTMHHAKTNWSTSTNGRQIITFTSIKPKRSKSCFTPEVDRRHRAENEQLGLPSLPGIQRVSSIKVIGVTFSNNLSMAGHVSALLDTCACKNAARFVGSLSPWSSVTKTAWMKFSAVRYWPSFCTQVLHGQAYVLQQTSANLTGSSTDVENCIVACSWTKALLNYLVWLINLCFRLCKRTVNTSSIAFYRLNQHRLTIFVIAVTVFHLLKNNPAMMTVISSPTCYYRAMLRRVRYCYGKVVCPSVRLSVTLRYRDHIGWKSSKAISRLVSLGCSLSADPNTRDVFQR